MTEEEVLITVLDRLETLKIPYMITGSFAVGIYGKPRYTHDVDLVVEVVSRDVERLMNAFGKDCYLSEVGIEDAIKHRSMFNILHHETGFKIDCWLVDRNDEMKVVQFQRRKQMNTFGRVVWFTTAEDVIVNKLLWYGETRGEKHLLDALGILQMQDKGLDFLHLETWISKLGLTKYWKELQRKLY